MQFLQDPDKSIVLQAENVLNITVTLWLSGFLWKGVREHVCGLIYTTTVCCGQ